MKGLLADILRGSTDCTNDGLTSKTRGLTMVTVLGLDKLGAGDFTGIFEPDKVAPGVVVEVYCGRLRAVPCDAQGNKLPGWFMFGGNFIHSSDSRFSAVTPYPIPVHDRQETNTRDYD